MAIHRHLLESLGYDSGKCFDSTQKSIHNNRFSQTPHFKIMKTFHKVTSVSNIESKSSERLFFKFWEQMGGMSSNLHDLKSLGLIRAKKINHRLFLMLFMDTRFEEGGRFLSRYHCPGSVAASHHSCLCHSEEQYLPPRSTCCGTSQAATNPKVKLLSALQ